MKKKSLTIVKEFEWMRDYIDSVSHLLPTLKQLKKISSKKADLYRGQHFQGIIIYYDKKSYRICLYTSYKDRNVHKLHKYSTIDLLGNLAHELAHLQHWDHTPQHKQLECTIMSIFMTKLAQDFYVSEEEELKKGSFY